MHSDPPRSSSQRLPWGGWCTLGLFLLGLLALTTSARAQDDPPGRVGRIVVLQGEAWVYDDEQGEWQGAQQNRPFTQGDRLSTAAGARVELRIGSTTLQLGGSSELDAIQLDDQRLQFALLRGSLALRLRSGEVAAELEVLTPEGRFVPVRSGLYRIDRQDETSFAGVWRGELQFHAPELVRTLQPGQRAEFWRDGPQRIARTQWLGPLDDEFAQTVLRDDQADTRSAATVFVSPEMTGVEDLDRYGGWQQHPEYGAVWTPTQVAVGWVPYRYGQWIWLRPWGWTWVDDAPWGFAPFHYGRWLSWGGRWHWAPGPRVARPVYAPALVAWAGGPQYHVVVGSRPVPAVGWVPLAPREAYRPGYRVSPGYLDRLNTHPPHLQALPPGHGNRAVPGAVTVLPASRLAPRQPVAGAALRADETVLPRQWQAERFHHVAPGRPAYPMREATRPRVAVPLSPAPAGPAALQPAVPPQRDRPERPMPPQAQAPAELSRPATPLGPPLSPQPPTRTLPPAQALPSASPMPLAPAAPVLSKPPVQSSPTTGGPVQGAQAATPAQPTPPLQAVQPAPSAAPVPHARPMPPPTAPAITKAPAPSVSPFFGGAPQSAAPQAPARERARAPTAPQGGEAARPMPSPATVPGTVPAPRATAPITPAAAGAQAQPATMPVAGTPPKAFSPSPAAPPPMPAPAAAATLGAPAATARPVAPPAARAEPAKPELGKGDVDRGERRRTPESRQQQREK